MKENKKTNNNFFADLLALGYLVSCVDKEGLYENGDITFRDSMINANKVFIRPMSTMLLLKFLSEHEFVSDYKEERKNIATYFGVEKIDISRVLELFELDAFTKDGNEQISNLDIKLKLLKAIIADNEKWYLKTYEELKKEMENKPEDLAVEDNEDIINIQKEIDDTKTKLEKVKTDLGIDDPIVVKLEKRIKMLEHKKQRTKDEFLKNPTMLSEKKKLADMKERYEKLKTILGADDPEVVALSKEINTQEQALKFVRIERNVPGFIDALDQISEGEHEIVGSQAEIINPDGTKEEKENEKVSDISDKKSTVSEEESLKQNGPKRCRIISKIKRFVSLEHFRTTLKGGLKWLGSKVRGSVNFFYPLDEYDGDIEEVKESTESSNEDIGYQEIDKKQEAEETEILEEFADFFESSRGRRK